jgi:hypothetical protein
MQNLSTLNYYDSTNTLGALKLKAYLFFPRLGIIQEDRFNYPRDIFNA